MDKLRHNKSPKVVFVEYVLNHGVRRAIPVARIALQLDCADSARTNIGAAPAPGFCPKFPAYGEVSVFEHGKLRMSGIDSFCQFTWQYAAQYGGHGNAGIFRVVMGLQIDPALCIGAKEHAQA